MEHLVALQFRVPKAVAAQLKAHCGARDLRVGEFLRSLVMRACDTGLGESLIDRQLARIETDQCFAAVALDALLAGHPDPDMRSRAHAAFVRKTERRRSLDASSEGDVL